MKIWLAAVFLLRFLINVRRHLCLRKSFPMLVQIFPVNSSVEWENISIPPILYKKPPAVIDPVDCRTHLFLDEVIEQRCKCNILFRGLINRKTAIFSKNCRKPQLEIFLALTRFDLICPTSEESFLQRVQVIVRKLPSKPSGIDGSDIYCSIAVYSHALDKISGVWSIGKQKSLSSVFMLVLLTEPLKIDGNAWRDARALQRVTGRPVEF